MRRRFFFLLPIPLLVAAPSLATAAAGAPGRLKYAFWPLLLLFALWWLVRGGRRPAGAAAKAYPRRIYLAALLLAAVLFGFLLGDLPNPVASVVAFFPASPSGQFGAAIAALLFFTAGAVAGTKLICGWGCPFGALQELLYEVPLFRPLKRHQVPFLLAMPLRTLFFAAFLFVSVGGVGLYAHIDPFAIFGRDPGWPAAVAAFVFLLLAVLIYRPFCQFVCPFGWYSWWFERASIYGIRIDRRTCVRCNACARACPTEAARGRLLASPIAADCFSCARCLRVCPTRAIDYGRRWRRRERRLTDRP